MKDMSQYSIIALTTSSVSLSDYNMQLQLYENYKYEAIKEEVMLFFLSA